MGLELFNNSPDTPRGVSPTFKPLVHRVLSQTIYQELIDAMRRGTLRGGQTLEDTSLAKDFGTSLSPVREALAALEVRHMVTNNPHHSWEVRRVGEEEVMQTWSLFSLTQGLVAEGVVSNISDTDIPDLHFINRALEEAAIHEDRAQERMQHFAFHNKLYELSGNGTL